MNQHEYRHLQAERDTLASFLAELPEESVIERMSLEARKEKIERMLASWTPPPQEPARACLTFRGKPVVDAHGIFADFGSAVVKAFTDAVAAIGVSQKTPLKGHGRLPNREDYRLLITDTALGSFGFELEEALHDKSFSEAPHADFFRGVSPVESAIKQTISILEATVGTDEMLTDAVSDTDPRALELLRAFLKKMAAQEAVCTLEFKDAVFCFSDVGQVRQSERHLSQEHIYEEEQEFSGYFRGVLPTQRTFEFLNEDTGEVISGKIAFAIEDVDAINDTLNRPVSIKVRSRRVGTARRRYVLLAYKDTSGQGEN